MTLKSKLSLTAKNHKQMKGYAELLKQVLKDHESGVKSVHQDSRVLVIDGLNSFIRVFSAVPLVNDDGDHIGGSIGFLRSIAAIIRQFSPTRCIIVFDGKGGSARRKKMHSGYKEGRALSTRFRRSDEVGEMTAEQEVESMKLQYGRLAEYLQCLPITLVSVDNIEADDAIAYIATDLSENADRVTIMSDDKDFLQLINEKTQVWRPVEKKLYTPTEVLNKFGVPSINYHMYKIFMGDNSDNIKGINGIGPKTLQQKFPILLEDRKIELSDLKDFCESKKDEHKVYQTVLDNWKTIELNNDLMQLHEVDIAGSHKSVIRTLVQNPIPVLDRVAFKRLFMLDKAYTAIPNVDSWLSNSFQTLNGYRN